MYTSGAVGCISKTQCCICLSSCEAENASLADCNMILFMRHVLGVMLPSEQGKEIVVHEDDEGAIHRAENPLGPAQSKHIGVRYQFIANVL